MPFKSFFLFISLGQAAQILRSSNLQGVTAEPATLVNGTLTSISVLEGSGCPAGTYHVQPIEPGKSLNTFVDFDPSTYLFNSTTTTAPVTCTLSISFEFIYPEDGQALVKVDSITDNVAKFEEWDVDRGTNFNLENYMLAKAGDDEVEGGVTYTRIVDEGFAQAGMGAALFPVGTPGEVGLGTFQAAISIFTSFGPGELSVSRTAIGFGLYETQ